MTGKRLLVAGEEQATARAEARTGNRRSFDSALRASLSDCLFCQGAGYGKDGAARLGKRRGRVSRFPTTPAAAAG